MALTIETETSAEPVTAASILVVSHDAHDARFHKRMRMFADMGFSVSWLAFDRARETELAVEALRQFPGRKLGRRRDGAYLSRLADFSHAIGLIKAQSSQASMIYCINLDNLFAALLAKAMGTSSCRVVYEVADIQSVLLRDNPVGMALRAIERWCLRRTDLVVYTSEHFMTQFLRPVQECIAPALLLENKIYPASELPERVVATPRREGPIMVGYFGQLRCARSLRMIGRLAAAFPDKLAFILRGYPNHEAAESFRDLIDNIPNVSYKGPYRNPADLAQIYSSVDLCWGFDFCCPGRNSSWCLTNRLYEAGYFGVPILVEDETAGGEFVRRVNSGWAVAGPLEESLHQFFTGVSPREIYAKRIETAAVAPDVFALDNQLPLLRRAFLRLAA